jgi:tRNA dimethylallyltransferase
MLKKLLVVCGPTAVGKTKLACKLAQKFGGEIVSADSRQIYKGMDIGTGKDVLSGPKLDVQNPKLNYKYYQLEGVKIWGYDLTEPAKDFSVSQYFSIARKFIIDIWHRGRLPIIVGGSGLYIKVLIDGLETISIPPDYELRKKLSTKNPEQLFELLRVLDSIKTKSINESDRKNPRRLIRAIEIAYGNLRINPFGALRIDTDQDRSIKNKKSNIKNKLRYDSLMMIGLTSPRLFINRRIKERVEERIKNGFEEELLGFLEKNIDWKHQSMQSLGYRQYEKFSKGEISWKDFVIKWTIEEQKYAKRQMTWFKKDHRIKWFQISQGNWEYKVEKLVRSWYYE